MIVFVLAMNMHKGMSCEDGFVIAIPKYKLYRLLSHGQTQI
jgi:hypothetical protein